MSVEQTQNDQPLALQHNEASKRKAYRSKATLSSEQNKLLSERERILLPFALRQLQKRIDVPADIQQCIFAQVPDAIASFSSYDLDAGTAIAAYGKPRSFFYKKLAEYVNRMIQTLTTVNAGPSA